MSAGGSSCNMWRRVKRAVGIFMVTIVSYAARRPGGVGPRPGRQIVAPNILGAKPALEPGYPVACPASGEMRKPSTGTPR
jgi:hypothetical protein